MATTKTTKKATTKKTATKKTAKNVVKPVDICDLISRKRADILDEEQKKRLEQSDEGMAVVKALRDKIPQLQEAKRIYDALINNNFGTKSHDYGDKESHRKKGYFVSDCWHHWEGFSPDGETYCTMGGGCNRFACGIALGSSNFYAPGDIVIGVSEFGSPCRKLSDGDLIEIIVKGGDGWHLTMNGYQEGYKFSGMEVIRKLKYISDNVDAFCQAVTDFANKVVGK